MLFSLLKNHFDLNITDTALKYLDISPVSLLLYLMVLKTISPGCGVRASLMLFFVTRNPIVKNHKSMTWHFVVIVITDFILLGWLLNMFSSCFSMHQ